MPSARWQLEVFDDLDAEIHEGANLRGRVFARRASHEAVVVGSARAMALRQAAPGRAGSQHPKDAVQHAAIIDARYTSRLVG